jgi:hypothetical protein
MPLKTLCSFNAAIERTTDSPAQPLGHARRQHEGRVVATALGLLLLSPVATFALELGEASIKSGLGQSLLVEIPYRLAENERLAPSCVGLVPAAQGADALPTYASVSRIAITATHIEIFDDRRVREPLIGLNVDVHCDTAPRFVRSYQLFVDPPARVPNPSDGATRVAAVRLATTPVLSNEVATTAVTGDPAASTPAATPPRANPSPRARGNAGGSLTQGQTYRVVRGDTLSGIAARIAARPATIRETADAIFAANSAAFTRGNRDLIEAGRSITIPIMTPATTSASSPTPLPAVREIELPTAAPAPPPQLVPTLVSTTPVPVQAPAPTATPSDVATEAPDSIAAGRTSAWSMALLALGAVILLSVPLAFVRRRKQHAPDPIRGTTQKTRPARPADPSAGIDVVEGRLARTSSQVALTPDYAAISPVGLVNVDPNEPVDLDVGAPVVIEERADWFADRVEAVATAEESAATVRMPDLDIAAAMNEQPSHATANVADQTIDDEQFTLTVAELDILRQDYETEHTLTQQSSEALREAVADLKATQAARATTTEQTVTLEVPQHSQTETTEITARIRAQ